MDDHRKSDLEQMNQLTSLAYPTYAPVYASIALFLLNA